MKDPLRSLAALCAGLLVFCAIAPAAALADSPAAPSTSTSLEQPASPSDTVMIPGPLRSFLRMAGISQEVTPPEVLPMLARNVFLHGYENGRPTEFLILIDRYLHQARELQAVAANGQIQVNSCDDATALIRVLGYRFEHGCSHSGAALITDDPERAFLTVDSGFPITRLEESLEEGTPFSYPYPETRVPVLFSQSDWIAIAVWQQKTGDDLVDVLLNDEQVGRLYSAMARLEPRTRTYLYKSPGLKRLLPLAATFDFYGGQICIPGHAIKVPGDESAEHAWEELAGVTPHSPEDFVLHLLSRDKGWLAAYFDALSRTSPDQQAHLVQGNRLKTLYDAYRSTGASVNAASGVFPRNAGLILLFSRLEWQADGQPRIPGNVKIWQQAFARQSRSYGFHEWVHRAKSIDDPQKFLEAMVAASNLVTETGPTQNYLMATTIDARRGPDHQLSDDTVQMLANRFGEYQDWYLTFADFPRLDDSAIAQFIQSADHVNGISAPTLRANALGAFQADIGLWKILARQKEIPDSAINDSWHKMLQPFASANNSVDLFNAARTSLIAVVTAAGGSSTPTQDDIIDLLAGPPQNTPDGVRVHDELANRIRAVLSDQRLVSLDTLFALYDGLDSLAHGSVQGDSLLPLAESLHEFEMPRPIFTGGERVAWSPLIYTSRHAELQVQTDMTKVIRTSRSPEQLEAARGRVTPFLRDTLVGLNYAYYEPPGAQVLHNNPLFVRSHDFSVSSVQGVEQVWGAPELIGIGATAGGGAYLMGSLVDLPYALASAEEDFISPEKVQALIWRETVPQLLVGAVWPRWWGVSQNELHAEALYQRAGEEMLVGATTKPDMREKVIAIFTDRFTMERLENLEETLDQPESHEALVQHMLPSDEFYLAEQFRKRFPDQATQCGPACAELDKLAQSDPDDVNPERLARDFGVPHPTLNEADTCTLLNREPFPVSGGYASKLFGESWESSNLYWARLADEKGYSPVMLNILVPELTHRMVANIFATYVDDWPALLRAMEETGTEFKQGKLTPQQATRDSDDSGVNGSASE